MLQAGRRTAGWLSGRILLFLIALPVLVAIDMGRDRFSAVRSRALELLPDQKRVERLSSVRRQVVREADRYRTTTNARLVGAHEHSSAELARWIAELDRDIARLESKRLGAFELVLTAGDDRVLAEQAGLAAKLQVMTWARDELRRVASLNATNLSPVQATQLRDRARGRLAATRAAYRDARKAYQSFVTQNPIAARVPFERFGIDRADRATYLDLLWKYEEKAAAWRMARSAGTGAETVLGHIDAARNAVARPLETIDRAALRPLDSVIADRETSVRLARESLDEVAERTRKLAWAAFWLVVLVSLMPVFLKAFWYFVMAPLAVRRPPIRLAPDAIPTTTSGSPDGGPSMSAVTVNIQLRADEELLVHPEYVQSIATPGEKRTKWLLDGRYPVTSLASGMVALTCIRGAGETHAISSKRDPLAEVGILDLPPNARFVLQPRYLVGVVQEVCRPIRISSRWNFGLSAWITLQFRYLLFHGPGRLVVAGCRGVRQEAAGSGRSIDQNSTMGFSANLDYVPRRSATFGAYLFGVNGLFDDGFAGGPGLYLYEEMPYRRRGAPGMTGRGLEGVSDLLLKVVGI